MQADQKRKGEAKLAEGEKVLKKFSFFGSSSQKHNDAAEEFKIAGNFFKVGKCWPEMSDAYTRAGDNFLKCNCNFDAGECFVYAADAMKEVFALDSIPLYQKAIDVYTQMPDKSKKVATIYQTIGEIYKNDNAIDQAVDALTIAADYFEADRKDSSGKRKCVDDIARLLTTTVIKDGQRTDPSIENYQKAAELLAEMAKVLLNNNLLQFHARDYFFSALLCYLSTNDQVAANAKYEEFGSIDMSLRDSREGKFFIQLLDAVENLDVDDYKQACADFLEIKKLEPWQTSMLTRVLLHIESEVSDDDEGEDNDNADDEEGDDNNDDDDDDDDDDIL